MTGTDLPEDEGLANRVLRTSAVVAGVFLVFLLQLSSRAALGFLLGFVVGLLGFLSWKIAADRLVRGGAEALDRKGKTWLLLLIAVKLPIIGAILAVAILYLETNVWALAGGVTVVPAVVVLKVVGKACFGTARRPLGPSVV